MAAARFTKADVTRALRGALAAGFDAPEVRLLPSGELRVIARRGAVDHESDADVQAEIRALERKL